MTHTDISKRILYTLVCVLAAVFLPYWIVFVLAAVGMYFFNWYVEGILIALMQDLFFATPLSHFHRLLLIEMFLMLIVFIALEIFKTVTRYGHS